MIAAFPWDDPYPLDDEERLAELYSYGVLDSPPEQSYDRVCRVAHDLLDVAIVAVSLHDRDRCWFKAHHGHDQREIPRALALSNIVLRSDELVVIPDLTLDPRTKDHPRVVGAPHYRFYAGVPLRVRPGLALGSLCLADFRPRSLGPNERELLSMLADMIVTQLKLRRANLQLHGELAARQENEERLAEQSRELRLRAGMLAQTARMAKVGGWVIDVRTHRSTWSDEVFRIHDLAPGEIPGRDAAMAFYPPEARARLRAALRAAVKFGLPFDLELPFVSALGAIRWVRTLGEAERENGRTARLVGTLQDITDRKAAEGSIRRLAGHDPLTGLPNRRLFQERLDQATHAARPGGAKVALLFLDLDQFKEVNDTLGHAGGDAILCAIADRLRSAISPGAILARVGGDEFAVILGEAAGAAAAQTCAEALMARLAEPILHEGASFSVGASIGVTLFPDDDDDAGQLLKNADIALYRAKASGRGRVAFFTPGMRRALESKVRLACEIREGLNSGAFLLHYQPIVSLRSGAVTGLEALLRWRHPERGLIGPGTFLPAFEDHELATRLGDRALDTALTQMRRWLDDGVEFGRVGVNFAPAQFRNGELAEHVHAKLTEFDVPAHRLVVEITECVFLGRSADLVGGVLQRLSALGVRIALDDFGTGYASLSHLKQFPVDILKIDQSFVQDIGGDTDDAAIVRAVVNLGLSLGLDVVAEGVETEAQLEFLRLVGCGGAQGYYFARALSPDRVPGFLGSRAVALATRQRVA